VSALEIVHVELAPVDTTCLHGRYIDVPKPGHRAGSHDLLIVGWVLGKVAAAVAVELVADGSVIGRAPVDTERPDLAVAFPTIEGAGSGGFRARAFVLRAQPFLHIEVRAVLASQVRVQLGTVTAATVTDRPDRVSVVIPCYNQAHFLGDALGSLAAQSVNACEVIVVDDGSTDNTAEVASRFPGVQTLVQRNAGLAAARNAGLRHATGDYVVFLDADDRLLPSALEVGLDALTNRPEHAFTYGRWRLVDADGSVLSVPTQPRVMENYYCAFLHMCLIWTPAAVMYRVAAVESAGGFDTSVNASADWDLYLRLTRGSAAYDHGETVADYRRHGANMTLDAAIILKSELAVLRAQRAHVRHDRELVEARRQGLHRAREHHGARLARDVRSLVSMGDWKQALQGARCLLRHHPLALLPKWGRRESS